MGHHSVRVLEWLFGAVVVFHLLGRLVRYFSAGGGNARAARWRIEAELAHYRERRRVRARPTPGPGWMDPGPDRTGAASPATGTAPESPETQARRRTLDRRLASVEEVLRQSSFEGERVAALAARDRILGQLSALGR